MQPRIWVTLQVLDATGKLDEANEWYIKSWEETGDIKSCRRAGNFLISRPVDDERIKGLTYLQKTAQSGDEKAAIKFARFVLYNFREPFIGFQNSAFELLEHYSTKSEQDSEINRLLGHMLCLGISPAQKMLSGALSCLEKQQKPIMCWPWRGLSIAA
jgi:hypothetical protein